ncbi:MAG: DNA alkylation repair protein [Firmicutes bacterium]|nr:DNA alkylation repair protein [Bacillota bacterium]
MAKSKNNAITKELFALQDKDYGEFQAKLIPTVEPEKIIGVRTPDLRALARQHIKAGDIDVFLSELPHKYFDENQLHVMILSQLKDYERCIEEVRRFLPYIDNWATCDQLSPKVFAKHKTELLADIKKWIKSKDTYTVRFAIGMLLGLYLDDDFSPEYPKMVAKVRHGEYYIDMMAAWYFATALAKQYDAVIGYIEDGKLDTWVHNKTIQKAVESYRITDEQKAYLKSLKRK